MTYARFHLIFNGPVLVLTALAAGASFWTPPALVAVGLVLLAVMVFTTPWDNYAVAKGIWGFPRDRFSWQIIRLPVEEYAFFIIQSMEVMWLMWVLMGLWPREMTASGYQWIAPGPLAVIGCLLAVWVALGVTVGKKVGAASRWHYAWHLFYWFGIVIVFQWVIGWPMLKAWLPHIFAAAFLIGTWLSFADWIAVGKGIWFFDEKQITGWKFRGILPWEEIAFFYLTSLLVAQSFALLRYF